MCPFLSETKGLLDPIYLQLAAVILLLCSPSLCAGACLPLLVRQITANADATGGVSGRVYAVNTVGSIAGALATASGCLPDLGSNQTILISMAAMALAAALTLPYTPRAARAWSPMRPSA